MKKVEGAEPGWYDDPEYENRERFWNGKYWDNNTRLIGEEGPNVIAYGHFRKGPLLFRSPISRDRAFKAYAIICAVSFIFIIWGEIQAGSRLEIQLGTLAATPFIAILIYIYFLPFLLIRRWRDKNKQRFSEEVLSSGVSSRKVLITVISVPAILILLFVIGNVIGKSNSKVERFLNAEKEITRVLGKYNSEAGMAVGVVRGISDGTLSAGEGIAQFTVASSRVTPILSELRKTCEETSFPKIEGEGEDLAIAKGMNMLKVVCDTTPRQFLLLQQIFREQVDESSSQDRLNELSSQLERLNEDKFNAAIVGIEALLPYANEAEAGQMRALLEAFRNR
jgi:uncharacterized membrane protein YhaH (DUF805 family)